MRTGGRGSKNPKILWTSYMDGPYEIFKKIEKDLKRTLFQAKICGMESVEE